MKYVKFKYNLLNIIVKITKRRTHKENKKITMKDVTDIEKLEHFIPGYTMYNHELENRKGKTVKIEITELMKVIPQTESTIGMTVHHHQ